MIGVASKRTTTPAHLQERPAALRDSLKHEPHIQTSNGRFLWLITRPGRAKFASGKRDQGTPEENKATVQGSLAYCGTYSVSGDTLIMNIESSTYPNEEGAEQRRSFTLNGGELTWRNPTVSTGASGVARLRRVN